MQLLISSIHYLVSIAASVFVCCCFLCFFIYYIVPSCFFCFVLFHLCVVVAFDDANFTSKSAVNSFVPDLALKRVTTGRLLRVKKKSYFIARTFRLHTQVPNALEKHLK